MLYFQIRNPIVMPRVEMEDDDHNDDIMGTMDFAVTRDFALIRDTGRTNLIDHKTGHSPKVKDTSPETTEANLHEMDL